MLSRQNTIYMYLAWLKDNEVFVISANLRWPESLIHPSRAHNQMTLKYFVMLCCLVLVEH